jgi:hypothetical protein
MSFIPSSRGGQLLFMVARDVKKVRVTGPDASPHRGCLLVIYDFISVQDQFKLVSNDMIGSLFIEHSNQYLIHVKYVTIG